MRTSLALLVVAVPLLWSSSAAAKPRPPSIYTKSSVADWSKAPPPTAEPTFKPPVAKRMKLRNGAALLVIENHALPIVSMQLVVKGAGSSSDPATAGGLASFTADLLDEGAGALSAIAIAERTDQLGASIRFGVDTDAAYVSVSTLAKTFASTLELMTTLITQPTFAADEVARVQGDRVTSLDQRRDRPREVAAMVLGAALYGAGTPYGHPTAGVRGEFSQITVDHVRTFYQERWNPAEMTLVVVGDVSAAAVKAQLDAGLGQWKPAGARRAGRPTARPAEVTHRLLLVDRKDAAQSDVRIGLIGPDRRDRRFFAFEVFRTTLGDGFTSRLVQRLREQLGITYGAGASMDWRLERGPFVIGTAIVTKATGQGIEETLKMLEDLTATAVPKAELDKSKNNLIRALPARFGTNAATAAAFAELALLGLPDDWYRRYAAGVRKVSARNVTAVARAVVPAQQLVVTVVGDLGKVQADLDKLGLGPAALYDLYGMPVPR